MAAQTLLDGLTTAVIHLDAQLRVRYINPAAEMLLHVSARQSRGHTVDDALPMLRQESAALSTALASG